MKKILVVGIILLFLGVTLAPTINFNIVKASSDNDFVEVTSKACGVKGYGNTTVKLTKQQYQDLKQYLVEFGTRLNQTKTREEAVPLFKDAVVELNKYGLLPKGLNVEQAQQLVIRPEQEKYRLVLNQRFQNAISEMNLTNYNFLCLVAGYTDVVFVGLIPSILLMMFDLCTPFGFLKSSDFAYGLWEWIVFYSFITDVNPVNVLSTIYVGRTSGPNTEPADGTLWSFGLLGMKKWNGSFRGVLKHPYWAYNVWYYNIVQFPGVSGFTGIDLYSPYSGELFIGTAFALGISY